MRCPLVLVLVLFGVALPVAAQQLPNLQGTWEVSLKDKDRKDVPRIVIVRADSSASWGEEHVRWRVVRGPRIMLAIGGEWEIYDIRLRGSQLTLSGGDLPDPVTLRRTGAATPRPANIPVPPDPGPPPSH
ncbi:MAG: hypothetical protein SGI84_04500 [Gemmatimonadota bacterium]|nr:hypothetical protein [Gemmatimonadota bacterium]